MNSSTYMSDMATARKLWIHCNSCFVSYAAKTNIIFLLACQHVACDKCVTAVVGRTPADPTYKCPICKKKVRGRQVDNALPSNLKDMFHPEPWRDGLPHVLIDTFQKANHKNLEKHIEQKEKSLVKLGKDRQLAFEVCRKHFREQQRLRMARKHLEFRARHIKYQAQLKRDQEQRRLAKRRKSESPNLGLGTATQHKRTRPASVASKRAATDPRSIQSKPKATLAHSAVTSFVHHNNHSFIL